ncbi:alpha/beta fold hydrolase [Pseudonocardia endophytica]|uniref:N-formylmaleamate deformylase n=1 Tax=Pseudonocardia endophytica TaxID=401976 RepID=A0A4R1HTZ4_PSEEN|nr:alpha/beta hydrolase [Pseudonocardia endophytica]TCK26147.1 N-formylmaleamate deformylase [Pseudonocardia endophytica]
MTTTLTARQVRQDALADLADVPATSRWVRNGDVRLHALDYGGDGRPVLVLPGITSPAVTLAFVARELTDLCRPIVLDVRGRGLSDSGDSWTLDDYADDVLSVLDGFGLGGETVLFGHSMGARIASVAATYRPLRGALLVDPPLSGPGRGPYPTTLEAFLGQLHEAQRGTDADEVAKAWPRWPRAEQELRARWLSSCDEAAIRATHAGFESEDFFTAWPSVPAPVTVLYGADSPVVTADGAAEVAGRNPRADVVAVPDAGHMVFWDNPAVAMALLRDALEPLVR